MVELPNNCRYLGTITDNKLRLTMEHSAIPVFEMLKKNIANKKCYILPVTHCIITQLQQ